DSFSATMLAGALPSLTGWRDVIVVDGRQRLGEPGGVTRRDLAAPNTPARLSVTTRGDHEMSDIEKAAQRTGEQLRAYGGSRRRRRGIRISVRRRVARTAGEGSGRAATRPDRRGSHPVHAVRARGAGRR